MSDGRIDGRFVVNTNLATSIRNELGISAEECKQMGSVWDAVVNEANNSSNYEVANNNKNQQTNSQQNNVNVQVGSVVKFTKECWNKIVDMVNSALKSFSDKQIQAKEADEYHDNLNLGKSAIQQFNEEHPNVESATYYGSLAEYLRTYGNDKNKLEELKQNPNFSELANYIDDFQNGKISIEELEKKAETLGVGDEKNGTSLDCEDRARLLEKKFNENGTKSIVLDVADIEHFGQDEGRGSHTFCVVGMAENADTTNPSTWGKNAVIVDAWIGKSFSVQEGIDYYKEFLRFDDKHKMTFGTREQNMEKLNANNK